MDYSRCLPARACVLVFALCACGLSHSLAADPADVETDPTVLEKLETFQDWKFGFMMHWGPYSQWGCLESWPLVEKEPWARADDLPAWVERGKDMKRFAADYVKLNETFNPQQFDPQAWAEAAKRAGMKYIVFTTKHHDGLTIEIPESTRQKPPCEHAWAFAVSEARITDVRN
jgi:alpha-L-fucosidase